MPYTEVLRLWLNNPNGKEKKTMKELYFDTETRRITDRANADTVKLPRRVGIIWSADQSYNRIVLSGSLSKCDYIFAADSDIPLLTEYLDQIEEWAR